jgi:hypothetical protein
MLLFPSGTNIVSFFAQNNLEKALANRSRAQGLSEGTAGVRWKSKEFKKRTRSFLNKLTLKKVLKYLGIALIIFIIVAIIVGVLCGMVFIFML